MRKTQEYTFEVVGRFVYCDGIDETSSEVQCETVSCLHRQPKLRLGAAHKLDCFFHAMHNNDIGNI